MKARMDRGGEEERESRVEHQPFCSVFPIFFFLSWFEKSGSATLMQKLLLPLLLSDDPSHREYKVGYDSREEERKGVSSCLLMPPPPHTRVREYQHARLHVISYLLLL